MAQNSQEHQDITATVKVEELAVPQGKLRYRLAISTFTDGVNHSPPVEFRQKIKMRFSGGAITFKLDADCVKRGWCFPDNAPVHVVLPAPGSAPTPEPAATDWLTVDTFYGLTIVTPGQDDTLSGRRRSADGASVSVTDGWKTPQERSYAITVINPDMAWPNNRLTIDPTIQDQPQ